MAPPVEARVRFGEIWPHFRGPAEPSGGVPAVELTGEGCACGRGSLASAQSAPGGRLWRTAAGL